MLARRTIAPDHRASRRSQPSAVSEPVTPCQIVGTLMRSVCQMA
jgi:hypothetical protein